MKRDASLLDDMKNWGKLTAGQARSAAFKHLQFTDERYNDQQYSKIKSEKINPPAGSSHLQEANEESEESEESEDEEYEDEDIS